MKKIIFILCLLLTITLCGCNTAKEPNIELPPVSGEVLPETPNFPDLPEEETEDEEEKKKKYYLVSTVNGLRVRSAPSGDSLVLGYLDKNDAVESVKRVGDYYLTVYKQKTAYVHANYCTIMEIEQEQESVENAISTGSQLLGYPYVWGSQRYHWGNGKLNKNFVQGEYDCSALVQYIYYISNGVLLDVTSRAQASNGVEVQRNELKRGDLMFFTNASRQNKTGVERIGHVGIYFGNNYILHTATDHAVIEPISSTRWGYYITARRVV